MQILTRDQFEQLIRNTTISITGLNGKFVRFNYSGQGQPGFLQTDNVIFITINYLDAQISKQQDVVFKPDTDAQVTQQTKYTRVIEVMWSFYGPNGFDLADAFKIGILNRANRASLSAAKVYPVPEISAPIRAPYLLNNQWWERVDLTAYFNAYTERDLTVPLITSAPIQIYDDHGLERTVTVE